jgi:hypothetical protein
MATRSSPTLGCKMLQEKDSHKGLQRDVPFKNINVVEIKS